MSLKVSQVRKVYETGQIKTEALREINFSVNDDEFVAIMGESGSGKTTLLNVLATFDQVTSGQILLNGQDISQIKSQDLASFRREKLGFVFQDFSLLDTFSNKDNILLPLVLSGVAVAEMQNRLAHYAKILGIEQILDKYPSEISGGQRQRIAIARALINEPDIILADEPTGALDSKTSEQILGLLSRLNELGNTILMVTHSVKAASYASRVLFIRDGVIFHEVYRGDLGRAEFQERIADSLTLISERG